MGEYKVVDRRPIGGVYRKMGYGFVDFLVAKDVDPDAISYLSVVFALAGGALLYASRWSDWLLLAAPPFFFLRLYCNMIDGMVAVKAGKCSARGEVVNELPDRISDTVIFAGLSMSGLADPLLACWVIVGMLFATYVGVLARSVGAHRQFGGVMSKQWRMFVLAGSVWAQFFLGRYVEWPLAVSFLDVVDVAILLGLVQTILVRTRGMLVDLSAGAGARDA
jgi:phosphatidylglycerophosphate synthase